MRLAGLLLLAACLLRSLGTSLSAPGRSAGEVLIGEVDIAMRADDEGGSGGDDDSPETRATEQPFANKCYVDNKAYAHSQMIPSSDHSSHCLCVAGEVYCWWQTFGGQASRSPAPTSEEGSADSGTTEDEDYLADEGPSAAPEPSGELANEAPGQQFDESSNGLAESSDSEEEADGEEDEEEEEEDEDEDEDDEDAEEEGEEDEAVDEPPESNVLPSVNSTSTSTARPTSSSPATTTTSTTTTGASRAPATCLVMGRSYREGEVLPHSTGNCVECSCGSEGRIECSPRDCVGLRPQSPGGGDLELFELDRPADGTF